MSERSATGDWWSAPTTSGPLDAVVRLPGSKSLTNRYLVLASLADAPSRLRAPLRSRDTLLMAEAMRRLGARVTDAPAELPGVGAVGGRQAAGVAVEQLPADWLVEPIPGFAVDEATTDEPTPGEPAREQPGTPAATAHRRPVSIDCGLAGTVMRFAPPVATLTDRTVRFDGDPELRDRPIAPLLGALRVLGARVDDDHRRFPATVHGHGELPGGEVELDSSASSQFVSGLLLIGARTRDGLTVRHLSPAGARLPSRPHVTMTVENLRDCGVVVDDGTPDVWRVEPGTVGALDVDIEPDLSNSGPFLAAALVSGGQVHVPGWPQHTTQAGDVLRDVLDGMGADVRLEREGLTVVGTGEISGVDVDLGDAGEIAPTVAALAALADTPSRLRGIGHLRGHETDRLAALATEFGKLGGDVNPTEDGLEIRPRPLHGGRWHSYADHRMATTAAVLGLRVPGILVNDVTTTRKTLPDFPGMWATLVGVRG